MMKQEAKDLTMDLAPSSGRKAILALIEASTLPDEPQSEPKLELLPCPFCGSKARQIRYMGRWLPCCSQEECLGSTVRHEAKMGADVLAPWNRRAYSAKAAKAEGGATADPPEVHVNVSWEAIRAALKSWSPEDNDARLASWATETFREGAERAFNETSYNKCVVGLPETAALKVRKRWHWGVEFVVTGWFDRLPVNALLAFEPKFERRTRRIDQ